MRALESTSMEVVEGQRDHSRAIGRRREEATDLVEDKEEEEGEADKEEDKKEEETRSRWARGRRKQRTRAMDCRPPAAIYRLTVAVALLCALALVEDPRQLHLSRGVLAFNVEPGASVVQQGPQGSYFGYSVAMHRDQGTGWLLVGAPRAQTNQPRTQQAGAVYRCSPSGPQACQQIPFDPNGSAMIQLQKELAQQDDKSRQWFGASIASAQDNGSIVACAPRYVYYSTNLKRRDPVGSCWVSRGSFAGFLEYSPCRLNDMWGHHHLGSCQAGFSSAISKDGGRLFMGAPGARVWQGQVFAHNLRTDLQNSTSEVNPHDEDDSYLGYSLAMGRFSAQGQAGADDLAIGIPRGHDLQGKVMLADREMRTLRNLTGEQMGAYFGYSLAAADLNGDGLDDLLVGAPLYYNQTFSHKEAHFERGRVYVYLQTARHEFQLAARWDGQRNRARFGSSLANCGDLNKDGLQDVAVGAPNDGPQGHGAVYIYLGRRSASMPPAGEVGGWPADQVIYAEQVRGHDGHQLRSFGWALAAGHDLDRNDYPDLLVGDYLADRAVLMRTRPVVNVTSSLTFKPEHFNLDERQCLLPNNKSSVPCISIQYCIKYTGHQSDARLPFVVDIRLDTDNQKGAPRMFFVDNELKSEDQLQVVYNRNEEKCKSFKAYIARSVRDKLSPLKVEVEYNLASDQQPELLDGQGLVRLRPIMNRQPGVGQTNKLTKVASIQRNCGYDNVCVPDLKLLMTSNVDQYTIGTDKPLVLDVAVKNEGEDAYESTFYLTMPMTINYRTTTNKSREVVCYGAKPEQTGANVLACDLGNPQPRQDQVKFSVVMEPARGHFTDADFTFVGVVNSTNPEQDDRARENNQVAIGIPIRVEVNLVLTGKSSPALIEHNSTKRALEQQAGPAGLAQLRREPQVETDLGTEVYHIYQLQNKGPSTINDIALTILWPTKTEDGESYLLYLVDEPLVDVAAGKVRCKPAPEGAINPLKLKYLRGDSVVPGASPPAGPRYKRQADSAQQPTTANTTTVDSSIVQQYYTVSCGPSQCTRFECNVFDLGNNEIATVKIRSRLYEETLDESASRSLQATRDFDISSRLVAQVKALPYSVSPQSMPPYTKKVETQVRRLDLTVQDLLPWWLILVAILLGLLLFALLACFLRYLGFFARKRPPKGAEREPLTPTLWNDYQYTPGDTAL